jgi:hypothetical protein
VCGCEICYTKVLEFLVAIRATNSEIALGASVKSCVKKKLRIVNKRNRERVNREKKILVIGDESVFGKRSLFWLKFEYVIFVTLLVI